MGLHRGPEAARVAAADPRRSLQDHGARDRPRPHGRPAAGPAVRADAHHRLRLRRHARQPQRPADRRRAEHRHRERQRGHRDLRPALRPGPGVQGADRDLRRPVRQHRGRRHQHEHQVRDEPAPRLGLLLRRAVEPGRERLLREARGARTASTAPRTGPASRIGGPVSIPGSTTGATRRSSCSATSASRTCARASTSPATSWVPTEALRNGDFSAYSSVHHDLRPADPRRRPATGSYVGQPFPGNIIPANRINPDRAGRSCEYYSPAQEPGTIPGPGRQHHRLDPGRDGPRPTTRSRAASTRRSPTANKMFVRGTAGTSATATTTTTSDSVASGTLFQFKSYQAVVDDVHIFNPTTVLNVRYGYNRFDRNSGHGEAGRAAAST